MYVRRVGNFHQTATARRNRNPIGFSRWVCQSCILCSNCPNSEYWQVPEEDKEVWEQHQLDVKKYIEDHGGLEELYMELNIDYNLLANKVGETKK